ncbi:phosphopantetheine-binding protein [Streptomyces sp. ISL-11]|uniref:phosphopantetheine-binding protein n=1 Tax=Streptomyces sp. ISL-11 TaxID=2819174 RepID=UPI001BE789AE|nr:phosphopantetheine-binding protein [Streptomyces sp. ISL-11]MBT2383358.1 acyl carrier protein [Streptomyces sp. ISL-11]
MDTRFTEMLKPFLPFLKDQPITDATPLRDLGLDSMQAIELMFAIEDTFGVELPDEALSEQTFSTAGNLWRTVAAALPSGEPGTGVLTGADAQ